MTKKLLIENISKSSYQYNKVQLLDWIKLLPNRRVLTPRTNKVGDIYHHTIFLHPIVLVKKKKDNWICLLMTSESLLNASIQAESRFVESYFSHVIVEVHQSTLELNEFMGTYNNNKHLREVFTEIKVKLQ